MAEPFSALPASNRPEQVNPDAAKLVVKPREQDTPKPEIVFIGEKDPRNPYVKHGELQRFLDMGHSLSGMMPTSDEGYHHNEDYQREIEELL